MKNVLYITHDGLTDQLGQSQIIPYLIGLAKYGFRITIVSSEKPKVYFEQKEKISALLKGANIKWIPTTYSSSLPLVSKLGNSKKLEKKSFDVCLSEKINIVHCRGYIAALTGSKLKKKLGIKFIFDMRGFWADERIEGGIWSKKNPLTLSLYRYFKKKEIEFINNSDYVISLTEKASDEILNFKKVHKNVRIGVIPCCVDLELFSSRSVTSETIKELKNKLEIGHGDFVLSYIGSIGTWYLLDEMLLFFRNLLKTKPNAKFLFITQENKKNILASAKKTGIPKNKIAVTVATRNEVPSLLSLSDLSVYFIRPTYSKKASSPVKMGEIMAMGIPAITNSGIGDSDRIIKETDAGIIIDDFSEKSFDEAITKVEDLLKKDKTIFTNAAKKYFSLEKGIEFYKSVYREVSK